jgi:hypothetical protein
VPRIPIAALLFAALTLACSEAPPSKSKQKPRAEDADSSAEQVALLPWAPGLSWVYQVTDAHEGTSNKTTTVGDEREPVGRGPNRDTLAYRVVTQKGDGTDQSISWQDELDGTVVRYREQSYAAKTGALELEEFWDPYKLHADSSPEHTGRGAQWLEHYAETKIAVRGGVESEPVSQDREDAWQVVSTEADDVSVTVPAGTFDHVLVVQKAGPSGSKTYWYARGVGKLKETGSQTEVLVSFSAKP